MAHTTARMPSSIRPTTPQRRLGPALPPDDQPNHRSVLSPRSPQRPERLLQKELSELQAEQQRALKQEHNRAVKAEAAAHRAKQRLEAETNKRLIAEARERTAVERASDEAKAFAEREALLKRELRAAVVLCEEMRAAERRRSSSAIDATLLPQSASDARVSESQRGALQDQVNALQGQVRRLKAERQSAEIKAERLEAQFNRLQAGGDAEQRIIDADARADNLEAQVQQLDALLRERTALARQFAEQVQQLERVSSSATQSAQADAPRFVPSSGRRLSLDEKLKLIDAVARAEELEAQVQQLEALLRERTVQQLELASSGARSAKDAFEPFEKLLHESVAATTATPTGDKM